MTETSARAAARVTVKTVPMWRIRAAREVPRYLVAVLALAGAAASARYAIAPPEPHAALAPRSAANGSDRAAEGYAALFARRYLSWTASESAAPRESLAPFLDSGAEIAARTLPSAGAQHVEWAEVVQARESAVGVHVYTVAAQTGAGVLYLSVPVARDGSGLRLDGYPAFVGPPAARPSAVQSHLPEVEDPGLVTVVSRALRNYLADSPSELAADLSSGARVSPPSLPLSLVSIERLGRTADGRSVVAVLQAQDSRGAQYTLAYELDVVRRQGRWEVAAVETDPDA